MRKVLKWIGIVIGGLVVLIILFVGAMFATGTARLNKTYTVQPATVNIPDDAEAIERGAYLYSFTCAGCHGKDGSGKVVLEDPALGYIPGANLTGGDGGVGSVYSEADWVRAIRHGVDPDGKPLMIMPAKAYLHFSETDLGAIIAYVNNLPTVDNDLGEKNLKPPGRILLALGAFGDILSAEVIDHNAAMPSSPAQGPTVEYGEYLVNTGDCATCHGPDLGGLQGPEPGAPFSSNLTPGGAMAIWSTEDFIETMRSGTTPYGRQLDPDFMPWQSIAKMTDDDISAMFLYLQSLPAVETTAK
jgi:mono/diheme cytochrome c family protein